jgi:ATP-binding cassette subfamily B protein
VKIVGLGDYLAERYRRLSDRFYDENKALAFHRAGVGALLNLLGTGGYYGAYVFIIARTIAGAITIGSVTFLAAPSRARAVSSKAFYPASEVSQNKLFFSVTCLSFSR